MIRQSTGRSDSAPAARFRCGRKKKKKRIRYRKTSRTNGAKLIWEHHIIPSLRRELVANYFNRQVSYDKREIARALRPPSRWVCNLIKFSFEGIGQSGCGGGTVYIRSKCNVPSSVDSSMTFCREETILFSSTLIETRRFPQNVPDTVHASQKSSFVACFTVVPPPGT